jgi:hypothetical protein
MSKWTVLPRMRLVGENFHRWGGIACAKRKMDTVKGKKWILAVLTSGRAAGSNGGREPGFYRQTILVICRI